MQDFFKNTLERMQRGSHGTLDLEQASREFPLVELELCDPVLIDVDGSNYMLSQAEFNAAIAKLRNARHFPTFTHFPKRTFANPNITPNQFNITALTPKHYTDEYTAIQEGRTVPSGLIDYSEDTRSFNFFGTTVTVNEQIHQHFKQGLKIYVWQNTQGALCWLPSHLGDHLERYLNSESRFEQQKREANEIIKKCAHIHPHPPVGLLNSLSFSAVGIYNVNMRMLHERGWGTGTKRNTVVHIGRVKGELADYSDMDRVVEQSTPLCGSRAKFGYGNKDHFVYRYATKWEDTGITCTRCIAAAKRILKQQVSEVTQVAS